jgi:hypothetical protein
MTGIDEAMQCVSRGEIDVENTRCIQVGSGDGYGGVERVDVAAQLKEQVVVVESTPGQRCITGRGISGYCDNMQVVSQPDSMMRAFELLNESFLIIARIDAQGNCTRLFQGKPNGNGLLLYTPQYGT